MFNNICNDIYIHLELVTVPLGTVEHKEMVQIKNGYGLTAIIMRMFLLGNPILYNI